MGEAPSAGDEYQLARPAVWWRPVIAAPAVLFMAGVGAFLGGWVAAGVLAGMTVLLVIPAVVALRWTPRRVALDEEGVIFVAPARHAGVHWGEVEAISADRAGLTWQLTDGRELRTPAAADGVQRLLADVGRRAPHVKLDV